MHLENRKTIFLDRITILIEKLLAMGQSGTGIGSSSYCYAISLCRGYAAKSDSIFFGITLETDGNSITLPPALITNNHITGRWIFIIHEFFPLRNFCAIILFRPYLRIIRRTIPNNYITSSS